MERLLMVFFSRIVLTKVTVNKSQVVETSRYVTMVFTINLFSNGKRLLMVFFSLIVLTKVSVNSCSNFSLRHHGVHHKSLF